MAARYSLIILRWLSGTANNCHSQSTRPTLSFLVPECDNIAVPREISSDDVTNLKMPFGTVIAYDESVSLFS